MNTTTPAGSECALGDARNIWTLRVIIREPDWLFEHYPRLSKTIFLQSLRSLRLVIDS